MKLLLHHCRVWFVLGSFGIAFVSTAIAEVIVTATSSSGSAVLDSGDTFNVTINWSGTPVVAAADYAVALNTDQLILTGRTFNATFGPYADTPYLPDLSGGDFQTDRIDITWFKESGFTGNDVTLHFKVPENYTGPGTITVGFVVDGAQDVSASGIEVGTAGTTVNILQNFVDSVASDSGATTRTVNWVSGSNALNWSPDIPGVFSKPDRATINLSSSSTSDNYNVDFNQNLTLNQIVLNMSGTVNYRLGEGTRRTVTWVSRGAVSAELAFARNSGNPLRNSFAANSVLNTNLLARFAFQGSKDSYFGGVVSGSGKLTIDYYNNVNSSTHATAGHFRIGTAGDAASTHSGGTRLVMSAGTVTPSNFRFWAAKQNAFGTGALELNKVRLDLNAFSQTVGGLSDGANGSIITDISTSSANSSTTNLTLDFSALAGIKTYAGLISDGDSRKIALTKSGSGTQILTNANNYTGATTVTGGTLLINGSLGSGTAVAVGSFGRLGGGGNVYGATINEGIIAPGESAGTLKMGAVTMQQKSILEIDVVDWEGLVAGIDWDLLECSSLVFAGTQANPVVLKLVGDELGNFSELGKTLVIVKSSATMSSFNIDAIKVDADDMPGAGTWIVELDATGKELQLVYIEGGVEPEPAFETWASAKGLSGGNSGRGIDADNSGFSNLFEFALNGDPLNAGNNGLFHNRIGNGNGDGGSNTLTFTIAVRRGAQFSSDVNNARVSQAIDGVVYLVQACADLVSAWDSVVADLGASDTPPAGSGLPNLAGTDWEYRSFSAFDGLLEQGFMRVLVSAP